MRANPPADPVETFRMTGAALMGRLADCAERVVMVTSPGPGEGRTTACAGLAGALGRSGHRVVAVDLDLRHPDLHVHFGAANPAGAAEVLAGVKQVSECLQPVAAGAAPAGDGRLSLLPAGHPPGDPGLLLSPDRLSNLFTALAADADVVLVDTPPLLVCADGLLVGPHTAGAVCVVQQRRTRGPALDEVERSLRLSGITVLGVLFGQERRR